MTRGSLLVDIAPADCWEDGFPVGNGRHGALVHGRPGAERVVVTHHNLTWPDAPAAPGYSVPPDLAGRLPRVRDLLLAGESRRALELFTGDWPRYLSCQNQFTCRRVRLPAGAPVRLRWGHDGD
jgi:hypothetical protein